MRATKTYVLCLAVLVLAAALLSTTGAARTPAECLDLGFVKEVVRCKYCEKLFQMTQHAALREECATCCTVHAGDEAEDQKQYESARIEGRYLSHLLTPDGMNSLSMFFRTYKNEPYFSKVSLVDKYSVVEPHIVLVGSSPKDTETVRVSMWSPETMHAFLSKKIRVD